MIEILYTYTWLGFIQYYFILGSSIFGINDIFQLLTDYLIRENPIIYYYTGTKWINRESILEMQQMCYM